MSDVKYNWTPTPIATTTKKAPDANSDYAEVVAWFDNDFSKADKWWMENHPSDYDAEMGRKQGANFVGGSRYAQKSPGAQEAANISRATVYNNDYQNDVNESLAKSSSTEDAAKSRNKAIQDIQSKILANNEKIAKFEKSLESLRVKYAKKADYKLNDDIVNENIAIADMIKLSEPGQVRDNTSFWRWNEARKDTKEQMEAQRKLMRDQNGMQFNYRAEALLKKAISPNYSEVQQDLSNIRSKIAEGKAAGFDVSKLEEREAELQNAVTVQYDNLEAIKKVKSAIKELDQRLANKTIDNKTYKAELEKLVGTFEDDELEQYLETKLQLGIKKAKPGKKKRQA